MLDVNKATDLHQARLDPDGNMFDLEQWSPMTAKKLAAAEGIILSEEHMAIIHYLRERFRKHGNADSARFILRELEEKFTEGDSRRILYELFPGGPVSQASRVAGLPLPPHASDPSFGSVE